MKILVTGATGFIGSEICRAGLEAGHEVTALVLPGSLGQQKLPAGAVVVKGSLEAFPWDDLGQDFPDCCIHCAWITTPGEFWTSPKNEAFERASVILFEGLVARNVKKIVALGTCAEYFSNNVDTAPPLYVECKRRTSQALFGLQQTHPKLCTIWARIFYPYGPGESLRRFMPSMIQAFLQGEGFTVQTGAVEKDYVYISDVASAIIVLAQKGTSGAYDIGSGQGIAIGKLAEMVASRFQAHKRLQVFDKPDAIGDLVANTHPLEDLGWCPKVSLERGIAESIEYVKTISEN